MERPNSVTAFGILNITFAGFGVLGLFGTLTTLSTTGNSINPVIRIMRDTPACASWLKLTIPLGLLSCGLLRLKNCGRKLPIGYAIYAIVFGIVATVVNYILLFRPLIEEASRKQGPEAAGAIGGAIGGSIGGCLGLIYPILLLVFMTRPKVVAAFHPPLPPPLPFS